MSNYSIQYRTFDQLLADVKVDFRNYELAGLIETQELIKVVRRVNYDLGLRIYSTKEKIIEIENSKARLPNDFYVLNFAMLCDSHSVRTSLPQGTHIEERRIDPLYQNPYPKNVELCKDPIVNPPGVNCHCGKAPHECKCNTEPKTFINCKGDEYELVQVLQTETRSYSFTEPLTIVRNPETVHCDCPNLYMHCDKHGWIRNGWLETNFKQSKCYISYQGQLVDDDGNLLCPDHEGLNDYYEYAVKERILENLAFNDETNIGPKLQLIQGKLRAARNYAVSIVNMPNFQELKELHEQNRRAQYSKYYDMFKSHPGFHGHQFNHHDGNIR